MSTAQTAIQARIEAQQDYDALEYGIRSIRISRHAYGASACHMMQIRAACQAYTRVTGKFIAQDNGTMRGLRAAKEIAGAKLKCAKEAQRAAGTAAQIRLELAA